MTLRDGLDAIENKIFRYIDVNGNCYEADFTGFTDLQFPGPKFVKIGCGEPKTPTPAPPPVDHPLPEDPISENEKRIQELELQVTSLLSKNESLQNEKK